MNTKSLKKYTFSFVGRQTGAIGITYKITDTYMAESVKDAVNMLFIDYEFLQGLKLNGKDYEIKSKDLIDNYPYKTKGMARK